MKLISLNTWCGIKYEALIKFIEVQSKEADIFCFQEIRNGKYFNQSELAEERINLFHELEKILSNFNSYYTEMVPGVGIASFVRKNIEVKKIISTQILMAKEIEHLAMPNGNSYYPRLMQSLYFKNNNLIVHNFHGIPGNSKGDTPERGLQTKRLLEIVNTTDAPQIIVGDFNLDMNTESVSKLSERMINLVKVGGFKTTRNSNYNKIESLPFADYAFVTKDILVEKFEVLSDVVSDHLALALSFK